jgi:hypothetical protein
MHVTVFQRDVAHILVDHLCTLAAELVHRAMYLDQLVTVALHDMYVHCHMFGAASHQESLHEHLSIPHSSAWAARDC